MSNGRCVDDVVVKGEEQLSNPQLVSVHGIKRNSPPAYVRQKQLATTSSASPTHLVLQSVANKGSIVLIENLMLSV
eukprot:4008445-Pyramimonas_sp.AAC.1